MTVAVREGWKPVSGGQLTSRSDQHSKTRSPSVTAMTSTSGIVVAESDEIGRFAALLARLDKLEIARGSRHASPLQSAGKRPFPIVEVPIDVPNERFSGSLSVSIARKRT